MNVEVCLLTDETGSPNGETLKRFEQRGPIYHLTGLHAKLYIVDDFVLLTSANLTDTAFTKRHETGVILQGDDAHAAVDLFRAWCLLPSLRLFDWGTLGRLVHRNRNAGEDGSEALPQLFQLPPDPGDFGSHELTNIFLDYERFLNSYKTLRDAYVSVQRIWPTVEDVSAVVES